MKMTSKEIVQKLFDRCIGCCFALTNEQEQQILRDLEVLKILKNTGAIELLFGEDPYCNYDFTDVEGYVIDLDYDEKAPTLEVTTKELKTIKEWLENDKQL